MSGVTPVEGLLAHGALSYQDVSRGTSMELGLWVGTWDGETDVTYAEATPRFTKVTGNGLDPVLVGDATLGVVADILTASWPQQQFDATGTQTVNGYYLAVQVDGVWTLETVERDPTERNLVAGLGYRVTPNITQRDG